MVDNTLDFLLDVDWKKPKQYVRLHFDKLPNGGGEEARL